MWPYCGLLQREGAIVIIILLSLGVASALDDPEPPLDYHITEGIWIKESGKPVGDWRSYNSTSDSLLLSSPTSKIDIAYVVRTAGNPPSVNASFFFYWNSDSRIRFLNNGSLLDYTLEKGIASTIRNPTNTPVAPLYMLNITNEMGEYHLGYTYYLFLTTFNPKRHSGDFQIRVNLSGISGGSSWSSPHGNPSVPWQFFTLPTEAVVNIDPFIPGDLLRASSRVNISGNGFPFGYSQRMDYEMFIDDMSYANGTYYGASIIRTGRQLPRNLEPGLHTLLVLGGEAEYLLQFQTYQWVVSLEVTPNITIPGGLPVNITGRGFPVNESYSIFLGDVNENSTPIHSGAVSRHGNFSFSYSFPRETPTGTLVLSAISTKISGPPTATAGITIDPWAVNLTAVPTALYQGEWINITGSNYPVNSSFVIYLDGEPIYQGATNENGTFFHREYTLSSSYRPGNHTITANATEYGSPPSGSVTIHVKQFNTTISVSPNSTRPGLPISIAGCGFPPNELVVIYLPGLNLGDVVTDANGSFSTGFVIPPSYPCGSFSLAADSPRFSGPPRGTGLITINQWPVNGTIDPQGPHPGGWVRILGQGFPPGSDFTVTLDGSELVTGTASQAGYIDLSPELPLNTTTGSHTIELVAQDYSGPPAITLPLEVTGWSPAIQVSPLEPRPGEAILISGEGFPRNRNYNVTLDGEFKGTGSFSTGGTITAYIFLRRNITLGTHLLNITPLHANVTPFLLDFDVVPWGVSLEITPPFGPVGSVIGLEVSGLPPLAPLDIYLDGVSLLQGNSSFQGTFSADIQIDSGDPNSYQTLVVETGADFTGPPGALAYFWIGHVPPPVELYSCDGNGVQRDEFYLGEDIHVKVSGLPAEVNITLHVIPNSTTIGPYTVNSGTDANGNAIVEVIPSASSEEIYSLWLDVNSNNIFDSNDVITPESFVVRPRPSISVESFTSGKTSAKKGEPVLLESEVTNLGSWSEEIDVEFRYGVDQIGSVQLQIPPGTTRTVTLNWSTSNVDIGRRQLGVEVSPLPGELNTQDNSLGGITITIESPPEISIETITPDQRELKKGDILTVRVKVRNHAPIQQIFDLELLWTDRVVVTRSLNIAGKSMSIEVISWSPDEIGVGRIRVRTGPIPYELNPTDNDLAAGMVTVLPPNMAPVALPTVPTTCLMGLTIHLSSTDSYDPDGELVEYLWEIGGVETRQEQDVDHVFLSPGTHSIKLKVTDDDGVASSNLTSVEVMDPAAFYLWASDTRGGRLQELFPGSDLFATIVSPGQYSCPLYIIRSGTASQGHELAGIMDNPPTVYMNGSTTNRIWTPSIDGTFDMVLDLDLNGVFSPAYDRVYTSVKVVKQVDCLMVLFSILITLIGLGRRGGCRG